MIPAVGSAPQMITPWSSKDLTSGISPNASCRKLLTRGSTVLSASMALPQNIRILEARKSPTTDHAFRWHSSGRSHTPLGTVRRVVNVLFILSIIVMKVRNRSEKNVYVVFTFIDTVHSLHLHFNARALLKNKIPTMILAAKWNKIILGNVVFTGDAAQLVLQLAHKFGPATDTFLLTPCQVARMKQWHHCGEGPAYHKAPCYSHHRDSLTNHRVRDSPSYSHHGDLIYFSMKKQSGILS